MAKAEATRSEITFTLELTEREAAALCELLIVADSTYGEGPALDAVYDALTAAGAEKAELNHRIVEGTGEVRVYSVGAS